MFPLLALIVSLGSGLSYLLIHRWIDKLRQAKALQNPVRRSLTQVPFTVVPSEDHEKLLRRARALIYSLVDERSLGVEMQANAEAWLLDFDQSHNDNRLLKRAYLLLLSLESGHKAIPMLSEDRALAVSSWLTSYLGKEERE